MSMNVAREVAALKRMTVKELRGRYLDVFGETTRSGNKDWLWKRIARAIRRLRRGTAPSGAAAGAGRDGAVANARPRDACGAGRPACTRPSSTGHAGGQR